MPVNPYARRPARARRSGALALPLLALLFAACSSADAPELTVTAAASATALPASPTTAASPAVTASAAAATLPPRSETPPPLMPAPALPFTPAAAGTSITIAAVGDISLAREVVVRMEQFGADYPYELVTPLLAPADITIANLEGALTERGSPWRKGYNFRTPPRFADGLARAGIDLVSLANNHTLDYGAEGLLDTLGALDRAGVRRPGAGPGALAAWEPAYVQANGARVAFIACARTPDESGGFSIAEWAAAGDALGLAVCDAATMRSVVAGARQFADFVVVIVHAGDEYRTAPNATQRALADAALAAGADAFIGHHAHVVQPVEQRGAQLIAWGLGNFIFDLDNVDLANIPVPRVSLVLRLTLTTGAGVTAWEAVPVVLNDAEDRPRPASPDEAAVLQRLLAP